MAYRVLLGSRKRFDKGLVDACTFEQDVVGPRGVVMPLRRQKKTSVLQNISNRGKETLRALLRFSVAHLLRHGHVDLDRRELLQR